LFVCVGCGQVHEAGEQGLVVFPASTAAVTTELAVSGEVLYLAVWRLLPGEDDGDDPVWDHIRRAAAPECAYLYVPAFSMVRPVVQRLGVRLTEVQPALELISGGPPRLGPRPALVEAGSHVAAPFGESEMPLVGAPDFDRTSPVLIGRREAWGLAHFVYLALEAREARDLQNADMGLEPGREELVFIPAMWDPRYIHESNWRLLLREFDGLVA
jgi:hypothetical protein